MYRILLLVFVAAATAATATTGGFQLRVEEAGEGTDAHILVRTYRCNEPERAQVSATAEGVVDGKRVSRDLSLRTVRRGVYTLDRTWPRQGRWVLALYGRYKGQKASTLVTLDRAGGIARRMTDKGEAPNVRVYDHFLSRADIDHALQKHVAQGD